MPSGIYLRTVAHKRHISESLKGKSKPWMCGNRNPMKNQEVAKKSGMSKRGKPLPKRSIESRKRQSLAIVGEKNHFFGKTHKRESVEKIQRGKLLSGDIERCRKRMLNGGAAFANSFNKNPSKPQVELFNLTKSIYNDAELNYPCLNYSIDVAIPSLNVAIEYDGSYWHKNKDKDLERQIEIEQQGWKVIRYETVPEKEKLKEALNGIWKLGLE